MTSVEIAVSVSGPEDFRALAILIKEVFDAEAAMFCSSEGRYFFNRFADERGLCERLDEGYVTLSGRIDGKIAGVLQYRDNSHISLFFVKKKFQGVGVGKALFRAFLEKIPAKENRKITVNSSPGAATAYEKLGFKRDRGPVSENGITYIPMTGFF